MLSTLHSPQGLAGQAELGTLGALYFNLAQGLKAKHEGKHEPLTHIAVSTAVGQHQGQPAARNTALQRRQMPNVTAKAAQPMAATQRGAILLLLVEGAMSSITAWPLRQRGAAGDKNLGLAPASNRAARSPDVRRGWSCVPTHK